MPKLSDSQLVILSAACKRVDGSVYPVTSKLTGGALSKVLSSLLAKGLIKEARAKHGETQWRLDDEERPLTLVITPAAFEALGIDEGKASAKSRTATTSRTSTKRPKASSKPKRAAKPAKARKGKPRGARADSKQARLIAMLKEKKGASIDEIVKAFGWQPHTVRGAIAGALKKRLGLDVTSEKTEHRGLVYRIAR